MKKHIMLVLCMVLAVAGIFALDVGGGMLFNNGTFSYSDTYYYERLSFTVDAERKIDDFGLYGFFGWKYMDIDFGVIFRKYSDSGAEEKNIDTTITLLQLSPSFKLPIVLTYFLRLFPTVGLSVGYGNGFSLGLHGGLGADFLLFGDMYLRGVFQYNYNLVPFVPNCFLFKLGVGWLL